MRGSQAIKDEGSKSKPSELSKMRGERVLMRDRPSKMNEARANQASRPQSGARASTQMKCEGPRGKNMSKGLSFVSLILLVWICSVCN